MHNVTRFMPAGLLLMGCLFVWNARSQSSVPLAAPLSTVLADLPGYRFDDQTISAEEARIAGMTTYSARRFRQDSVVAFSTLVSYYDRQTQGKTIHSPRNCLPGAGWEVLTAGTAVLSVDGNTQTVNRYILKNGPATALVFYWYQGRGRIVANEYAVKWNLLRDAAVAGHTEEALVRIVLPVSTHRAKNVAESQRMMAAADSLGTEIAARLIKDVSRVLPRG